MLRTGIFERVGTDRALLAADTRAMLDGTEGYEGTQAVGFCAAENRIHWTGRYWKSLSATGRTGRWPGYVRRSRRVRACASAARNCPRHCVEGRKLSREVHDRIQAEAVRGSIPALIASLDRAIAASEKTLVGSVSDEEVHLRGLRVDAELAAGIEHVATRSSAPSPGM